MRFNFGSALGAAAILTLGATAYGEDTKPTEKETKEAGATSSDTTNKPASQTKKRAGKRHQARRGGGPVGDEGAQGQSKSGDVKSPDLSPDTGLLPSTTQQKAGKEEQLQRGAGPAGEEGKVGSGQSRETPSQPDNPPSKDTSATPESTSSPQK
jgi:hypothetical protein